MRTPPLVLGLILLTTPLVAQGTLQGTVAEDGSRRPMGGVEVILEGTNHQTTTDSLGRYRLTALPTGRRVVMFRTIGFRPVRMSVLLARGDTTRMDALMVAEGVELDSIVVTERPSLGGPGLAGFAERQRLGLGRFFDSTELRRMESLSASDLLGRHAGVIVQRSPTGHIAISPRRNCAMEIRLDGSVIGGGGFSTPPDLRLFGVSGLVAVEVYRSPAEVPMEYGGRNAACGVVLLWTRRQ